MNFDGSTFNPERDGQRLGDQMLAVLAIMSTKQWFTLGQLSMLAAAPEASVSARIRDLRKPRFGGHTIEREYVRKGLWRYRLVEQEGVAA